MLFNTPQYVFLFLPLALCGFWLAARWLAQGAAVGWLVLCSLVFYGWWDSQALPLLLGSVTVNYLAGLGIGRLRARRHPAARPLLFLALAANLALLGLFKYSDFFLSVVNRLAGTAFPLPHLALPLGISFFTFTQMAFLVDVQRGLAREYRPLHYLLFVTYFPHLIAGPILHHRDMMPQFADPAAGRPRADHLARGLCLFSIGLCKKLWLADTLAPFVDTVFAQAAQGEAVGFVDAWLAALAYTLQLYFDFSGYTDMAIGASLMAGIRLPVNFNSPYRAVNINDFWRRWHMTLGRFFRDYVYIPLGGNRHGLHRTQLHVLAVMLLSGLWHGAGWTFLVWGGLHGLLAVINQYWRVFRQRCLGHDLAHSTAAGRCCAMLLTFVCVVLCWVVFRAATLPAAWQLWQAMLMPDSLLPADWGNCRALLPWLVPLLGICWCLPNTTQVLADAGRWSWRATAAWWWLTLACLVTGGYLMLYRENVIHAFLYFNF